jgi:dTDP-4-amino-4,6-dideoxygalactose transaminase
MSDVPLAEPRLDAAEEDAVLGVLRDGQLADGPAVRAFESAFADYCGAAHGVATASGTAALHAALHAVGVGEGDVVVTTPFSFAASANAVRHCGATPVFADVDPETYNLDPAAVAAAAEAHDADAVLAVHLYGLPADVEALRTVADRHDLLLVEDAAQAHGAAYRGERAGTFGDAAAFSFYPTKNVTTGEGGMVTTDDPAVAERAARFVDHGQTDRYHHVEAGYNYRMTSIAAAIGSVQLEKLPAFNEARRANAERLTERLSAVPEVTTPTEPPGRRHVYHQYTVQAPDRDGLRAHLDDAGVGTGVYYPVPIHEQPPYVDRGTSAPVAERLADEVLSLPVHPGVSEADVDRIATAVEGYYD